MEPVRGASSVHLILSYFGIKNTNFRAKQGKLGRGTSASPGPLETKTKPRC